MREIKFRAWDKELNCWMKNPMEELMINFYSNSGMPIFMFDQTGMDSLETRGRYFIQQYTGLKDKNGKEIYDGDILEVDDEFEKTKHKVSWGGNDYPAWTLTPGLQCETNDFSEIVCGSCHTIEVVGNIYENPELIK